MNLGSQHKSSKSRTVVVRGMVGGTEVSSGVLLQRVADLAHTPGSPLPKTNLKYPFSRRKDKKIQEFS